MTLNSIYRSKIHWTIFFLIFLTLISTAGYSNSKNSKSVGNFGLPGIIDLPTAQRLPEGELVITQQVHRNLARSGIAFQPLPRIGFAFNYSGHGRGGIEAYGRRNHDRSFDAHLSIFDEGPILPAISIGLRDFIGTGWYSSEYIVGTKTFDNFQITAGLGFGRLAGKNAFSNPLGVISSKFKSRKLNNFGQGGTLGTINWFHGTTSPFFGFNYKVSEKISIAAEYTSDLMSLETWYLTIDKPWNFGLNYQINDIVNISTQYLYGNQFSITANLNANPNSPPKAGGNELAPVPMRLRNTKTDRILENNIETINRVLTADNFQVHFLEIKEPTARIHVTNTKFRSTAQAVGRIASTLQRFTSDNVKFADISFHSRGIQTASYRVNLEDITNEQFNPFLSARNNSSIVAKDLKAFQKENIDQKFSWGLGPYFEHRLFNPEMPLSMETGLEVEGTFNFTPQLKLSGALRKSVLTNLTDNKQRSGSVLPRVHSDWPLYDLAGQSGHIHELTLSYAKNIFPGLYGRAHAGLLEPFFAGVGGELLYKPIDSPVAFGLDIHQVRKRNYPMRFDLLEYKTAVGHVSIYYDAGGMFDLEINAGRYLAGDWGATTTISRKFGSGWEVGGYATLTDVPFETFGEGSFDKAIYFTVPIDWIISKPDKTKRRLTIRPITRDGGANLASSRQLYKYIEDEQNSNFEREYGRLWK